MGNSSDVVSLAERLIACESVTPARGPVFDALEAMLAPLGFEVHRFVAGGPCRELPRDPPRPAGSRHFAFAGHLDVVPRARAGAARRSRPSGAAACSTAAARST
jgi:succinyl-diaminopimelate desuccinylase